MKQLCDLRVDVLYRFRLALIGLEDFEELFVDLGLLCKSILDVVSNNS
jgi:hypothetical protein